MDTRGRPPGQGKVPGSGRKRGSLDKSQRLLVTEKMAADILKVYKRLGPDWLFTIAKDRPDLFLSQCLSRLLPPAIRDDPDVQVNTQVNIGSDFESARRIAFALAKAAHEQEQAAPVMDAVRVTASRDPEPEPEMSPQEACRWVAPDQPNPSPHQDDLELDPARQRWIEELPLTDEQRADAALVRRTIEGDITTYVGSAREQFDAPRRPSASQPSAGERRRAVMSRRGRELL